MTTGSRSLAPDVRVADLEAASRADRQEADGNIACSHTDGLNDVIDVFEVRKRAVDYADDGALPAGSQRTASIS